MSCVQGCVEGPNTALVGGPTFLRSGLVAPSQTTPLWGGMGITPSLAGGMRASLGAALALATAANNLGGFTVFSESDAMVRWDADEDETSVPQAHGGDGTRPGGAINWVALRSHARIWVQCAKQAAMALAGASSSTAVYWDYTNQVLLNTPASLGDSPINARLLRFSGGAQVVARGGCFWDYGGFAALIEI
jgi:hypothetical protein